MLVKFYFRDQILDIDIDIKLISFDYFYINYNGTIFCNAIINRENLHKFICRMLDKKQEDFIKYEIDKDSIINNHSILIMFKTTEEYESLVGKNIKYEDIEFFIPNTTLSLFRYFDLFGDAKECDLNNIPLLDRKLFRSFSNFLFDFSVYSYFKLNNSLLKLIDFLFPEKIVIQKIYKRIDIFRCTEFFGISEGFKSIYFECVLKGDNSSISTVLFCCFENFDIIEKTHTKKVLNQKLHNFFSSIDKIGCNDKLVINALINLHKNNYIDIKEYTKYFSRKLCKIFNGKDIL